MRYWFFAHIQTRNRVTHYDQTIQLVSISTQIDNNWQSININRRTCHNQCHNWVHVLSEIVDSVTSTTTATTQPEDEDDDAADYEPTPAMSEVVKGLQVGLRWLEASDRSTAVEVTHLRNILHRAKAEARESCRQTMLTDFFFRN